MSLPTLPARSTTLKTIVLLPDRTAPVQLIAVPLTMLVMLDQELPLSKEPYSTSSAESAAEIDPVIVWAAALVTKSAALPPVSVLMSMPDIHTVGGELSRT